ncbi:MAG: hypothetical protein J6X97_02065 [Lachnospiraceae bacterium]|nr:hypothetical protein [Lachnospiraceae bacterium]
MFNHLPRKTNIIKAFVISGVCALLNIVIGFGYRYLFLKILSIEYLGINGLFTNILGLLALAELGITGSIVYRFYDPISKDDVKKVGELMRFFKNAYLIIAGAIFGVGLAITPFLKFLIKDAAEVPADVNLYVVFILFLLQSASTYLFSYKLTLLSADQKQDQFSVINIIISFGRYSSQIIVLFITKNYTLTLLAGILITMALNFIASLWVASRYKFVFDVKSKLDVEERKNIYKDTTAAMFHKIGGTVLNSTDNILLSKFIGLAITGIYSNYYLITYNIMRIIGVLFQSFTSSLGNAHFMLDKDSRYVLYKKSLFLNFAVTGLMTVCAYSLINDFILVWLRKPLFLDDITVILIIIQFYMEAVRFVSMSYTSACGLFVRDKARPLIQAFLNLLISIIALKKFGISGIFIGTIISSLVTVFWREPYLLYKNAFGKKVLEYWFEYIKNVVVVLLSILILQFSANKYIIVNGMPHLFVLKALACMLVFVLIHFLFFFRTEEYKYMISLIVNFAKKIKTK